MNKQILNITVNGKAHQLLINPNKTLSQVLREDLGLTGTKQGCGVGDCGSCTVFLDGQTVNSCLVLGLSAEGREVHTIESLAKGNELHPIQDAFVQAGAIQCGFCSPGMILSAKALLDKNQSPTEDEIRQGLAGNLCRCTGYQKIVDAVMNASQKMSGEVAS
jgi:carbon-monoxide dehydrogenase small subunit